jgi:spore coat protein A
MTGMSRRTVLQALAAAGVGVGVGGPLLSGLSGSPSTGVLLHSRRPLPARFAVPLTMPAVLEPQRADATTDYYDITAQPALARILPDAPTPIWGYQGTFPGPTVISRSGRPTVITHRNRLEVPMVVHLHGGHTPADSDGYPTDLVLPAGAAARPMTDLVDPLASVTLGARTYTYPLRQRAATLWYHDHRMGFTGASVWRGLAGFHIVRDEEEDALPLPHGRRELPLLIADRSFDGDGSFLYPSIDPTLHRPGVSGEYTAGVLGDVVLVNGRPWPYAEVDRARYRLRLLNASNARRYRLRLDPTPPEDIVQIGSDGGLLARPLRHEAVQLAPAERCDVIVDFSAYTPGQRVRVLNDLGTGPTEHVMEFRVGHATTDDSRIPDQLSHVPELRESDAQVTRRLLFQNTGGEMGWTINGAAYAPERPDVTVRRGTTEAWHLVSDFHHPVHLHLAHFQIVARGIRGPGEHDHGWKDVIDLRPAERATIVTRFEDHPGRFVFHCHNLEHEDMAMMGNLKVL